MLRAGDFSSNSSLFNTNKSPGPSATLFDKEGLNFRNFITPFIKRDVERSETGGFQV
jgi:hypothetical protein